VREDYPGCYIMFLNRSLTTAILGNSNEILSIKNISCETLGSFEKLLLSDGYRIKEVLATRQTIPENIDNFDAIFILGGPMSANDRFDCLLKEKQLIVNSLRLGIPVLGICLGSQLIAESCGGKVYPGAKKEIGWSFVDIAEEGKNSLFKDIPDRKIQVFQWHGDTFALPENSEVLSSSSLYMQAFRHKTAYGIQFHLEVTQDMIFDWIRQYREEILNENIDKQELVSDVGKKVTDLQKLSKAVYRNFISLIN
jgi:GMP synthase (glutamine-hydrolysing)